MTKIWPKITLPSPDEVEVALPGQMIFTWAYPWLNFLTALFLSNFLIALFEPLQYKWYGISMGIQDFKWLIQY